VLDFFLNVTPEPARKKKARNEGKEEASMERVVSPPM